MICPLIEIGPSSLPHKLPLEWKILCNSRTLVASHCCLYHLELDDLELATSGECLGSWLINPRRAVAVSCGGHRLLLVAGPEGKRIRCGQ